MKEKSLIASIICNDHAELLLFELVVWGENDECTEFFIMDSYE